jgi:hypothetical protein
MDPSQCWHLPQFRELAYRAAGFGAIYDSDGHSGRLESLPYAGGCGCRLELPTPDEIAETEELLCFFKEALLRTSS